MKYCLINNLYPPYARGGAEQVVADKVQNLVDQGHEVVVITSKPWSGWGSWIPKLKEEKGVKIYRFWPVNIFSYQNIANYSFVARFIWHVIDILNFVSARIIKQILQQENPDVVNTHNLMGLGFLIPKVIQNMGLTHVHTLHDVQLVEPSGRLSWNHHQDNVAQKIYSWLMKKLFNSPDKIISPSKFLQDFYQQRNFFSKSEWVTLDQSNSYPEANEVETPIKFLYVGNLERYKGINKLIKTWEYLKNDQKELHIVGDGSLLISTKDWAQDREEVKIYGRVRHDNMADIYKSCDALIFPSICIENDPQVIVEALDQGLSILAAKTGGVAEFEAEHINFFEPGNVKQMKEVIENFSANLING